MRTMIGFIKVLRGVSGVEHLGHVVLHIYSMCVSFLAT